VVGREETKAVAPRAFRHIHCLIGIFYKTFRGADIPRRKCYADTGRDVKEFFYNWERICQFAYDFSRHDLSMSGVCQVLQNDSKFVTAETRNSIRFADAGMNAICRKPAVRLVDHSLPFANFSLPWPCVW
jgi:hypothetical protein